MSRLESLPNPDIDRENSIEEALIEAGLTDIPAPRKGTPAYDRLIEAAEGYISAVKEGEKRMSLPPTGDAENYFSKRKVTSPSDSARREYHDKLAMMLFGSKRKELTTDEAGQVSNFAAYVTGHEEYINTWRE